MAKDRRSAFGLPQLPAKVRDCTSLSSLSGMIRYRLEVDVFVIIICNGFVLKYRWLLLFYYVLMVIYSSKYLKGLINCVFQLGEKNVFSPLQKEKSLS